MCDPRYEVAYHVVHVMKYNLQLVGEGDKVHKINVQETMVTYPVNEFIRYLPD